MAIGFLGRGGAPTGDPFAAYLAPKTMTQQGAMTQDWANVGKPRPTNPFGNGGDISGAGWTNPLDLFARQAAKDMESMLGQPGSGAPMPGQGGGLSGNGATQYDQVFIDAANEMSKKYGVNLPASVLKAMANIESGGTFGMPVRPSDDYGGGASVGMMQIKPQYWGGLASSIGADIYDPVGNIRTAAALMAQTMAQNGGSWERAISEVYHPGTDTTSGYSPDSYIGQVRTLMGQYGSVDPRGAIMGQSSGPGGSWTSIFGGAGTPISYEYDAPSVNGGMYNYAAAYGLSGNTHPAIDVSVPRGTPLYSPGSGTVSCVGGADAGIGGTGGGSCGHFPDADGGGIGNITIKLDNGTFVILGHSGTASVQPGQRVNAGTLMGTSGGMYGAHIHLEVRVPDASMPSGYRVVDPRSVLGGAAGGPASYGQANPADTYGYGGSGSLMGDWASIMDPNAAWRTYRR